MYLFCMELLRSAESQVYPRIRTVRRHYVSIEVGKIFILYLRCQQTSYYGMDAKESTWSLVLEYGLC